MIRWPKSRRSRAGGRVEKCADDEWRDDYHTNGSRRGPAVQVATYHQLVAKEFRLCHQLASTAMAQSPSPIAEGPPEWSGVRRPSRPPQVPSEAGGLEPAQPQLEVVHQMIGYSSSPCPALIGVIRIHRLGRGFNQTPRSEGGAEPPDGILLTPEGQRQPGQACSRSGRWRPSRTLLKLKPGERRCSATGSVRLAQ